MTIAYIDSFWLLPRVSLSAGCNNVPYVTVSLWPQGRQQRRLRRRGSAARAAAADAAHELRAAAAPSPADSAPATPRSPGPARKPRLQHEGAEQDVRHDGLGH